MSVSHDEVAGPRNRASGHPPSSRSVTEPHHQAFTTFWSLLRRYRGWLERGSQKPRELARDRNGNLRRGLMFGRQLPETPTESLLRLIGHRDHPSGLPSPPPRQREPDARAMLTRDFGGTHHLVECGQHSDVTITGRSFHSV